MVERALRAACLTTLAFTALAPVSTSAQVVRGTVSAEDTRQPMRGAVVTLLDASLARTGLRVLTDDRGAFAMRAPAAGTWAVEVRAIGFGVHRSAPRRVHAGETIVEAVVLRRLATRLATLRVEARSQCRRAGDLDAVTSEVWDDVWAALAATAIAREQRLVRADVFVFTREVDVASGVVLHEERGVATVLDEQPFRTASPSDLARFGYWRQAPGGVEFHGLDAGIIMSPEFLAAHCFTLTRSDSGDMTRVGLAFRPVNARAPADVQGILWVDAKSRELRELEFSYTGLQLRGPAAGGRLQFSRLDSGLLIDDRWTLHHPFERARGVGAPRTGAAPARPDPPRTALRLAGGFVLTESARTQQFAAVAGSVRERGAPADAVSVEVLGAGRRFVTDTAGVFRIDDVLPGTYELRLMRPGSSERGGFVQHGRLTVAAGELARVTLDVPGADAIARELCPDLDENRAPLFAVVREHPSGRPAADYRIEVQWTEPADSSGASGVRSGAARMLSDWRGEVVACQMPAGAMARFRTTTGPAEWSLPIPMGRGINVVEVGADTARA